MSLFLSGIRSSRLSRRLDGLDRLNRTWRCTAIVGIVPYYIICGKVKYYFVAFANSLQESKWPPPPRRSLNFYIAIEIEIDFLATHSGPVRLVGG